MPSKWKMEPSNEIARVSIVSEMEGALSSFEIGQRKGETLIEQIVDGVIGGIGAIVIVAMTALVFGNAVGRYAFNMSAIWADELVVALMPWLAVCGVFLSIRQREMIRIDYFIQKLPARPQRAIALASQLLSAGAFVYLAIGGFQYVQLFGADTTLYLEMPTGWFTSALCIGSGLVVTAFLVEAGREFISETDKS